MPVMTKPNRESPAPDFTPVLVAPRADGWTPAKQVAFIEALGATGCVAAAAASVGMCRESAYRLRARPDAAAFRAAWEQAIGYGALRLGDAAMDRALNGVPVPIFYKGEQVGERRHFDERLTMFLLRTRDPLRNLTIAEQSGISWHATLEGIARRFHEAAAALFGRAPDQLSERDRPSNRA